MSVGLFPGQGIPAKMIAAGLPAGDPLLDLASQTLRYDLRSRVRAAAPSTSSRLPTNIAQPAIFVASLISCRDKLKQGLRLNHLIGHSLGEYAALAAAGAFSVTDGLVAVAARGEAMQKAAIKSPGGMVALIGLDHIAMCELAAEAGVAIANDNSPQQIVVAGKDPALELVATLARKRGGRAVRLPVLAPFHTEAMAPAAEALSDALFGIEIRNPAVPVISNVTARPYRSPGEIRRLLVTQLTAPVRFRDCVATTWEVGARSFTDLGPGAVVGPLANQTVAGLGAEVPAHA